MQGNSILETVAVPGTISGTAIIRDLTNRIADKLSRDCNLRSSDAYSGYSAKVELTIQLHDIYPVEVIATTAVGSIDPSLPSTYLDLDSEVTAAPPVNNLERPVDAGVVSGK